MFAAGVGHHTPRREVAPLAYAVGLLSQQVWCWGRDVLRPEGNWLLEIGFTRFEPPAEREDCSSVYTLELPGGQTLVLRGFGVLFSDHQRGAVFLPRYEFQPRYAPRATHNCRPWCAADMPHFRTPTVGERYACASLTWQLIDWIRTYEVNIIERLGIAYRRETLVRWDKPENRFTPAENFASAWRDLSFQVAANFDFYLGGNCK